MHYDLVKDTTALKLMRIYLNFIRYVYTNENRLYNFVDYDKVVNLEDWSEDAHGRAMMALGYLISKKSIPKELRIKAELIFEDAKKAVDTFKSPRAVSFILIGLCYYNLIKKSEVSRIKKFADYLVRLYKYYKHDEWNWFENYLTYSNSKLPEALFFCYTTTKDEKYLTIAKESLDFLISVTFKDKIFAPIGQNGWYNSNSHRARFDQQPVDAGSMVQTLIIDETTKN